MVHPRGLVDALTPDEHQHHLVHDLGVDPRRHHRHEPFAQALQEDLPLLEATCHGDARRQAEDIVIAIPGRQPFEILAEGVEVLRIVGTHHPVDLIALHGLHLPHPPVERVERMVVVVQPGSPTLDGIVLQPTVFLTVRDDVPSQLDMVTEPVFDLINAHPQFLIVGFPLAQPLGALRLTRLLPAALLDLPGQEEVCLRVVIRLRVVGEDASFPNVLPAREGFPLQLLTVVVVAIEQHLLVELPLQTDLITCIHLVTIEDVEHVCRGERQQGMRVVTHRLQEGGVCLKPDDRESRHADDILLSRTALKHPLHQQDRGIA